MKSKHTQFWYRLQTLNDKIFVFRSVFYGRMPSYQKAFYEKKQRALEEKLKEEKVKFEKEMQAMNKNMRRKIKKTSDTKDVVDSQVDQVYKG
jgi:hypothetical protein